jgi:PAS domain S-box-containing protein
MCAYSIKKPIIVVLIAINMVYFNVKVSFAGETEKNHILILNSYHKGYAWTDGTVKGIEKILKNNDNIIRIEYMDTKEIKDGKYLSILYDLYKHKFDCHKFDVIIANDNDAYNFLKKYHKDLFKDIPIICSGLNTFDDFITNKENGFTGIAETIDIKKTLDVCFKLHKNVKNVIITADNSLASDLSIEIIKEVMPLYGTNKEFYFSKNDSIEKQKEYLSKIPENSMILQIGSYKDKFQEPITVEQGDKIISESVDVPIYSCWDMHIGNGIIGGMVANSYNQGKMVAQMAQQVLDGKDIKEIPFIKKSESNYIFDYNAIKKYNIKTSDLPIGSTIVNKPSVFLKIPKDILYTSFVFFSVLLIFINFFLFKNISKLRKIKKENIKEKRILQAILDSTGDGILVVDKDKAKIHHNNNFVSMWGIPEEILARNNNEEMIAYAKEQLIGQREFIKDVKEKLNTVQNEIVLINFKDGRVFELLVQSLVIEDKASGTVWNFRDITERIQISKLEKEVEIKGNQLEEAKEYERIKDQFFSTISHELKTPLNIILGVVQLIDKTFCQQEVCTNHEKLKKYMNMSKQNCFRLVKLINNLIDITKFDSGFMHMEFKNYNIVSVIENITLSIAEYIESKGIQLIFDTEIEERIISCDADKLERVMLNLLSNAIKFTEQGGTIVVNIYNKVESIVISVKDTGIGIPLDMKEKIFDRFTQVESTLRRRAEGSGIGLSLVKAIVELHNGTINLESNLGAGSEFIIELPVLLLDVESYPQEKLAASIQSNVEKISIEFSDIYS